MSYGNRIGFNGFWVSFREILGYGKGMIGGTIFDEKNFEIFEICGF